MSRSGDRERLPVEDRDARPGPDSPLPLQGPSGLLFPRGSLQHHPPQRALSQPGHGCLTVLLHCPLRGRRGRNPSQNPQLGAHPRKVTGSNRGLRGLLYPSGENGPIGAISQEQAPRQDPKQGGLSQEVWGAAPSSLPASRSPNSTRAPCPGHGPGPRSPLQTGLGQPDSETEDAHLSFSLS